MATLALKPQWYRELVRTISLAWPLVVAQLAVIAINTTDVIMMGWLSPEALAAGTLAHAINSPILLSGMSIIGIVTPLVAQGLGARDFKAIRRSTRQGLWIACLLSVISIPILLQIEPIILFLGQSAGSARLADVYMSTAAWYLFPTFLFFVLRSLVTAHGNASIILKITVVGIVLNIIGNYSLIFGNFGMPRLELAGAGISTTIVNSFMFLALLAYVLTHKRHKRYYILVRIYKPDWAIFRKILALGIPVGFMTAAEAGLFSAAAILMGWIGIEELAGHAVALQIASIAFMVPLGLSYATTIRVGYAFGKKDIEGVAIAAWISVGITLICMCFTLILFSVFTNWFIHWFLDPSIMSNKPAIGFAASYILIVAIFQIVDGSQVVAAAALRGINDTKAPMYIAVLGYWGLGLPVGYLLGFELEMRGVGVWWGLAAGLAFVAVVLLIRLRNQLNKLRIQFKGVA